MQHYILCPINENWCTDLLWLRIQALESDKSSFNSDLFLFSLPLSFSAPKVGIFHILYISVNGNFSLPVPQAKCFGFVLDYSFRISLKNNLPSNPIDSTFKIYSETRYFLHPFPCCYHHGPNYSYFTWLILNASFKNK